VIKRTQKERDQEANANSGRKSVKTEQLVKINFFRKSSVAQIEKYKTNES
jgi:hypothetical protein